MRVGIDETRHDHAAVRVDLLDRPRAGESFDDGLGTGDHDAACVHQNSAVGDHAEIAHGHAAPRSGRTGESQKLACVADQDRLRHFLLGAGSARMGARRPACSANSIAGA
jgi:hypothetical protein